MAISRIESNSIAPSQTLTTPIIATTMGVGGATPAGSGSGITFPAAQSASTDANTLDDYEEGTWTPTISANTPPSGIGYSTQYGRYTKIGNVVYVSFRVSFGFSSGTGSGALVVNGLPFTSAGAQQPRISFQQDNITYTSFTYLEMGANQNATNVGFGKNRSGGSANSVQISDCSSSSTDINGGLYYFV